IAYAGVAGLPPQYGLYSSFMACFVYTVFGSVKDSAIGPTAIAAILTRENLHGLGPEFAVLLAFLSGCVELIMGILQLGECVPSPPRLGLLQISVAERVLNALLLSQHSVMLNDIDKRHEFRDDAVYKPLQGFNITELYEISKPGSPTPNILEVRSRIPFRFLGFLNVFLETIKSPQALSLLLHHHLFTSFASLWKKINKNMPLRLSTCQKK
ncbi:jg6776, partial [Pararge aegeria aegeria]